MTLSKICNGNTCKRKTRIVRQVNQVVLNFCKVHNRELHGDGYLSPSPTIPVKTRGLSRTNFHKSLIITFCNNINVYYSSRIYGRRRTNDEIFVLLLTNMGHFLILELGDYDYCGITANNWPHPHGNTAVVNSIPAVLPPAFSPLPWVVPITVQLTSSQLWRICGKNATSRLLLQLS